MKNTLSRELIRISISLLIFIPLYLIGVNILQPLENKDLFFSLFLIINILIIIPLTNILSKKIFKQLNIDVYDEKEELKNKLSVLNVFKVAIIGSISFLLALKVIFLLNPYLENNFLLGLLSLFSFIIFFKCLNKLVNKIIKKD